MGRAVFAEPDGVMGEDIDTAQSHQRRHAHRVARIVGEHQEGAAIGYRAAVHGETVHHRAHCEFAHTVIDVIAIQAGRGQSAAGSVEGEIGTGQIGRSAQQFRQQFAEVIERAFRGLARGFGFFGGGHGGHTGAGAGGPIERQAAVHDALEFGGEFRMGARIDLELVIPGTFARGAGLACAPGGVDLVRHDEGCMGPVERDAGGGYFVDAERRAVAALATGLVRRTVADHGFAYDEGRTPGVAAGGFKRGLHGGGIVAIDGAHHLPAVGFKARGGIVGEPALHVAVDGNAVVVIAHDELAQAQGPGQRAGFVGHAFHQTAVAGKHIGVMVD